MRDGSPPATPPTTASLSTSPARSCARSSPADGTRATGSSPRARRRWRRGRCEARRRDRQLERQREDNPEPGAGRQLGVPFHELDALHHGPNWTEATPEELRAKVEPLLAEEAWVIDGAYMGKLGLLVVEAADTVVWVDLPMRIWLPRLLRRTVRRIHHREVLWNGNQESIRNALCAVATR